MTDRVPAEQERKERESANQLVVLRAALEEAETIEQITPLMNQADIFRMVARKAQLSRDAQNDWAEYKLNAERKAGAMLKSMGLKRGRPKTSGDESIKTLEVLGINYNQSSNWQRLAELPVSEFLAYTTDTRAKGKEITEAGAIAKAKHIERENQKKQRATQAATISAEAAVLERQSCLEWLPNQPDCDLLLTDPPYSTDVDDIDVFAQQWMPLALAKVKPTGRAYVCVGAYPQELRAYLNIETPQHLKLSNVLVWTYRNTLGPAPKFGYKLNWQAILYYEGVDAPPLNCPEMVEQFAVQDINAPDGRHGDRWHAWQKPDALAQRFIRHSTNPGDIVLDPFAGTGTFILNAAQLGRKAYGCDINPDNIAIAVERGCQV